MPQAAPVLMVYTSMGEALCKVSPHPLSPPPLQESKGVAKRKAAEQDAAKANRIAKKLRIDMRRRGHVRASRKVSMRGDGGMGGANVRTCCE